MAYWYAVFVKCGKEEKVRARMQYKFKDIDDEILFVLPKLILKERKGGIWYEREKTLLPGYVLINGEMNHDKLAMLRDVPDFIKLLKTGDEIRSIPENEIFVLGTLMQDGETIGISDIIIEGDKVAVVDGPLKSLEGIVKSIDKRKGRARIRVSFLGDERLVTVGVNIIDKL
jgi:transcriptional antiterminator NusG